MIRPGQPVLTGEDIQRELDARLYTQDVATLRFRRALKLKDGSLLSCQDHKRAAAVPGRSFEVAYFAPEAQHRTSDCEELGPSDHGVYGRITPEQIADIVNLRGGLKA